MNKLDQATIDWIEKNYSLINWLKVADEKIRYGQITINYHDGKITSYDICPRERVSTSKN